VLRKLGAGAHGVVYEAIDRARDARVALKTITNVDPLTLLRFKREFRTLVDVDHPNVVHLFELVSERDEWFFTMDLLEGTGFFESLGDLVDAPARALVSAADSASLPVRSVDARVREERVRRGLLDVVRGLRALHERKVLHRDIKPSNILRHSSGRMVLV